MIELTEPHTRRGDCSLCVEKTLHLWCPRCNQAHVTIYNGHHDHETYPLDICASCGTGLEIVPVVDGVAI